MSCVVNNFGETKMFSLILILSVIGFVGSNFTTTPIPTTVASNVTTTDPYFLLNKRVEDLSNAYVSFVSDITVKSLEINNNLNQMENRINGQNQKIENVETSLLSNTKLTSDMLVKVQELTIKSLDDKSNELDCNKKTSDVCIIIDLSKQFYRSYISNYTSSGKIRRRKRAVNVPELSSIDNELTQTSKDITSIRQISTRQEISISEVKTITESNADLANTIIGVVTGVISGIGLLSGILYKFHKWYTEHKETKKNVQYVRNVSSLIGNRGTGIKSLEINSDVIFGSEEEHEKVDNDPNCVLITSVLKPRVKHKVSCNRMCHGKTELKDCILVTHAYLKVANVSQWVMSNNAMRPCMISDTRKEEINNALFDSVVSSDKYILQWGLRDVPSNIMSHYGITDLDDFDYRNLSRREITSNTNYKDIVSSYIVGTIIHSRRHVYKIIISDIMRAAYPHVGNMAMVSYLITRQTYHSDACDCKTCQINDRTAVEIKKTAIKTGGTGQINTEEKTRATIDSIDSGGIESYLDQQSSSSTNPNVIMGLKRKNIKGRMIVDPKETKSEEIMMNKAIKKAAKDKK